MVCACGTVVNGAYPGLCDRCAVTRDIGHVIALFEPATLASWMERRRHRTAPQATRRRRRAA